MGSSVLDSRRGAAFSAEEDADFLAATCFPIYERLFDEESEFVRNTETKLAESRIPQPVEIYLSRAIGVGLLAGLTLWLLGLAVGYLLFATGVLAGGPLLGVPIGNETLLALIETLRTPFLVVVTGLFFGAIGFAMGFGSLVAIPYSRAAARRREINLLLADSVSFMYALSVGGLNQLELIEAMAGAEDTYGEVAKEFRSIVNETEYFDDDYRTAIRKQVDRTPSDELAEFLTDMLAIVDSGGDMEQFLEDKKHKHLRTAKQQQERILDTLELFGEMYITLSLFPLLLIIVLIVMSMLGEASRLLLYLTVYGLIPLVGVGFLVLISTVKQDDPGDGRIRHDGDSRWIDGDEHARSGLLHLGLIEAFTGTYEIFTKIRRGEGVYAATQFLKQPHHFFRDNPLYTLAVTVPVSALVLLVAGLAGAVPTTLSGFVERPVWGTFVVAYLPLFVCGIPLAVFVEWNRRSRRAVLSNLSDTLRKLAGVNDTGMTLLESIGAVAETSSGRLAREFRTIYLKVNYGMNISDAFVDFNNDYRIPRLARTVRLITKAQSASNEMRAVLSTAATASENADDLERERRARTRMQIAIVLMTFLTLLGVMAILKTQFLGSLGDLTTQSQGTSTSGGPDFGSSLNTELVSLLFFHAVTIQAVVSGFISGYIRDADLLSGVKYVVGLLVVALAVWAVVG